MRAGDNVYIYDVTGHAHKYDLRDNIHCVQNPSMFNQLCDVLSNKLKWATNIVTHSKKYIYEWIEQRLPLLADKFYTPATKIFLDPKRYM